MHQAFRIPRRSHSPAPFLSALAALPLFTIALAVVPGHSDAAVDGAGVGAPLGAIGASWAVGPNGHAEPGAHDAAPAGGRIAELAPSACLTDSARYEVIAWYHFDEDPSGTINDASGNGHHGVVSGTGVSSTIGVLGRALHFPGNPDRGHVTIPVAAGSKLDFTDRMSIDFWFRPDVKYPTGKEGRDGLVGRLDPEGADPSSYMLHLDPRSGVMRVELAGPERDYIFSRKNAWSAGVWYHVVVLFNGALPDRNLRIFVDGQLDSVHRARGPLEVGRGPLLVGAPQSTIWESWFAGAIDELCIAVPRPITLPYALR